MALLIKMTVMFSPRPAACRISAAPIEARSPSPWYVKTILSGETRFSPVAMAGARPCAASAKSTLK
jgi:hypothetical protein